MTRNEDFYRGCEFGFRQGLVSGFAAGVMLVVLAWVCSR